MALRVLLADESSTIKKVFQLALQDFAVEVRSVNIGVDVASVTTTFKPDIIFADVLLQKKNGYDVCAELKGDPKLKSIPVVLMWSGFMELDEDKFQASQADQQLEKPFDVAALRKLVAELVPRTQKQKVSQYLTFPKASTDDGRVEMPDIEEESPDLVPDEEFKQVPIPKIKGGTDKYRLDLKPEELDPGHIPVDYDLPSEKTDPGADPEEEFERREVTMKTNPGSRGETVVLDEDEAAELHAEAVEHLPDADAERDPIDQATRIAHPGLNAAAGQLDAQQLEKIIRKQSAEVIESVVWKVVPELAKQIIERELNRLLKERDSHPY